MTCIISIFTVIGFITTCVLIWLFVQDQIGIYKINQKWKKEKIEKENEYRAKNK